METIPDTQSGQTARVIGVLNHPETGFPFSIDGTIILDGQKRAYLALESMPKELLSADSAFFIRPEIINRRPAISVEAEVLPSEAVVLDMKPEAYSREREINAGYRILAKAEVGAVEYALAENPNSHFFATWERTPGNDKAGESNYYWGHYHENRDKAVEDFCSRVSEKCAELAEERKPSVRKQLAAKHPAKDAPASKSHTKGAR